MSLNLSILVSTSIKRKKPWSKLAWLGAGKTKEQHDLFLLDNSRISQLFLPSGKTRKKIPALQPFLVDVQALNCSANGQFLVGALKSGKVFVWNKGSDTVNTTPILDKIRSVLGTDKKPAYVFVSNCGTKILLLSGYDQLFLWESKPSGKERAHGEPFTGVWMQIQSGEYHLPTAGDKEAAIDAIFYDDLMLGLCAMVSWVFNKEDTLIITTLRLSWSNNASGTGQSLPFTAKWYMFRHPLYGLTPAARVVKSKRAYLGHFSPDGQILAVAMNQKYASDNRIMFYSTASLHVAMVNDLNGCGAQQIGVSKPSGRMWWVADLQWTSDSLLLIAVTRAGSVLMLTKLGTPLLISTKGNSIDMGPSLFLPIHPRIYFRKSNGTDQDDISLSSTVESALRQRFSIAVHPHHPVFLISDGYLVTVLQLPGNVSHAGLMTALMSDVKRLVPDIELDLQIPSRSSSLSKINIFQAEPATPANGDDISDNTASSAGSSNLKDYGLASGDQGVALAGFTPMADQAADEHYANVSGILEAQLASLKALGLATSAGEHWTKDISNAANTVTRGIAKLFGVSMKSLVTQNGNLKTSLKLIPESIKTIEPLHGLPERSGQRLKKSFAYFQLALGLFQWDSYRNAFSWAIRLVHHVINELLAFKGCSDSVKITTSIQFLEFSERILNTVYSWNLSGQGLSADNFSPTKMSGQNVPLGNTQQDVSGQDVHGQGSKVAQDLAAPWLLLYNYTAQCSKRSAEGHEDRSMCGDQVERTDDHADLMELMCSVQRKLQDIGAKIPTMADDATQNTAGSHTDVKKIHESIIKQAHISGAFSTEALEDSMFARKRATQTPAQQSTPVGLSKRSRSLDHLKDLSAIGKPSLAFSPGYIGSPRVQSLAGSPPENDTRALLSILYQNLQQYDVQGALELVYSLMEPVLPLEEIETTLSDLFTPIAHGMATPGQDQSASQLLSVLLQSYPIIRVSDKCGLPVVQSLARLMAAYFSDLPLFTFPPYRPEPLPPFHPAEGEQRSQISDESFELMHGAEVEPLNRERLSIAVREQGLSDLWSANSAVDLLLVTGLIGEAALLSRDLGDWKNSFFLSVSNDNLTSLSPKGSLPSVHDNPEKTIISRLAPIFHTPHLVLPSIQKTGEEAPDEAHSPTRDKLVKENPTPGTLEPEIDANLVRHVSHVLQAGVVAGLDLVPVLMWTMLKDLLGLVAQLDWIVPEGLYLPSPPLYCPQPPNTQTEFLLPRVYQERHIRSEAAKLVQKILTLFHASRCMTPCTQWYVEQLVAANDKWYGDDGEFEMPQSLISYADCDVTFTAAEQEMMRTLKKVSTKGKDKRSPPRSGPSQAGSQTGESSSIDVMLSAFQQFCLITWLLHARDKRSYYARRYRRELNEPSADAKYSAEDLCWETLQWTLRLLPFSSLLGATSQLYDTLLTLLSEMTPSVTTAEITAQHFHDPDIIPTTAGKAKLKRLISRFRRVTLYDAGCDDAEDPDAPLSVYYREKCIQCEHDFIERRELFGPVQVKVFEREELADEYPISSNKISFKLNKERPQVGALMLESSSAYLGFLDTFFIIVVSKTSQYNQSLTTPLLLAFEKVFTAPETKSLKEIQAKASTLKRKAPLPKIGLIRSQSFADVRSSRPRARHLESPTASCVEGPSDYKRSSSLNDLGKAGNTSGIAVLGAEIMKLLPKLVWLSRWSSQGSSHTLDVTTLRTSEGRPVMKVQVKLQLLINSIWLMKNVYIPWQRDEKVNPEFLKPIPKAMFNPSLAKFNTEAAAPSKPEKTLIRRYASDTDIPRVMVQSPTTEEEDGSKRHTNSATRRGGAKPSASGNRTAESPLTSKVHTQDMQVAEKKKAQKKKARKTLRLDLGQENERPFEDVINLPHDLVQAETEGLPKGNVLLQSPPYVQRAKPKADNVSTLQKSKTEKRRRTMRSTSTPHRSRNLSRSEEVDVNSAFFPEDFTALPGNLSGFQVRDPQGSRHPDDTVISSRELRKKPRQVEMSRQSDRQDAVIPVRVVNEDSANNRVEILLSIALRHSDQGEHTSVSSGTMGFNRTVATEPTVIQGPPSKHTGCQTDQGPSQSVSTQADHTDKAHEVKEAWPAGPLNSLYQGNVKPEQPLSVDTAHVPKLDEESDSMNAPKFDPGIPLLRMPGTSILADKDGLFKTVPDLPEKPRSTTFSGTSQLQDGMRLFPISQDQPPLPLLHIPENGGKRHIKVPDLSKIRFFEMQNNPAGLQLLKMPPKSEETRIPDLSKIKFPDTQKKTQVDSKDLFLLQMPLANESWRPDFSKIKFPEIPKKTPVDAKDLFLLRMPQANESWMPDLSKIKFAQVEPKPSKGAHNRDLRLLRMPERAMSDLSKIHFPEKHPNIENFKPDGNGCNHDMSQAYNARQTISRQRRRERQDDLDTPAPHDVYQPSNIPEQPRTITVKPMKTTKQRTRQAGTPPTLTNVKPQVSNEQRSNVTKAKPKPRPPVEINETGLSAESDLELSEISEDFNMSTEEQMYFHPRTVPRVSNREVERYCRELEERVKEQFNKDLEVRMKEQVDREVKERIRRQMEKELQEKESQRVSDQVKQEAKNAKTTQTTQNLGQRVGAKLRERAEVLPTEGPLERGTHPMFTKDESVKRSQVGTQVKEEELYTPTVPTYAQVGIQVAEDELHIPKITRRKETSAAQTDTETSRRAPMLPPDIFLGLRYSKEELDDQGVQVEIPSAPRLSAAEEPSRMTKTDQSRRFLSVADIDGEEWENIRAGPEASSEQQHPAVEDGLDESKGLEEESVHGVSSDEITIKGSDAETAVDTLQTPIATPRSARPPSDSPRPARPQPEPRHLRSPPEPKPRHRDSSHDPVTVQVMESIQSHDPVTVQVMESIQHPLPKPRFHLPVSLKHTDDPRGVSKQLIASRLSEMTEQLDAIERITQNMDREFQSSNVLLRAIENIGDVMSPSRHQVAVRHSPRLSDRRGRSGSTTKPARIQRDITPWRRETTGLLRASDLKQHAVDQSTVDNSETERKNDTSLEIQDTTDQPDAAQNEGSENKGGVTREKDTRTENRTPDRTSDEEESDGTILDDTSDSDHKSSVISRGSASSRKLSRHSQESGNEHVSQTKKTEQQGPFDDPLSSIKLTPKALKEIFADDSKATTKGNVRSPEKRKEIREWMARKRTQQHAQWQGKVEELRSQEHKPFVTTNEGPSTLKKIKLAEKERETKRRNREQGHINERVKDASNMISEMLSEAVPKADTLTKIRYTPPKPKTKAITKVANDRYETKTTNKRGKSPRQANRNVKPMPGHAQAIRGIEAHRAGVIGEHPLTSSPIYPPSGRVDPRSEDNAPVYPNDEFTRFSRGRETTRSVSPNEFVTVKTYRQHEKEKLRRSHEFERQMDYELSRMSHQSPTVTWNPALRSLEIDHILDEIPDGSTIDEDRFQDIQSLLSDDSELKELLADVISSQATSRERQNREKDSGRDNVGMRTMTISKGTRGGRATSLSRRGQSAGAQNRRGKITTRGMAQPRGMSRTQALETTVTIARGTANKANRQRSGSQGRDRGASGHGRGASAGGRGASSNRKGVALVSGRGAVTGSKPRPNERKPRVALPDDDKLVFDVDEVSPWNTGDSLKMSDDIAQLLAEAKQAVGDDFSESSGSVMSNIDWEAVDRIMDSM
ncbi:uncharacterized protein LOC5517350 isoform X2 [Nematostella vectensis]|uniref:uncharacterized protein LOC5517350 isoform X2 n=1 Tax=Nematostella vectensis TaxID=45351 RepID=UPI0020771D0D|nr:uncharacterized protein LOC5517350 isoform X2 [Nematostella vectensis]